MSAEPCPAGEWRGHREVKLPDGYNSLACGQWWLAEFDLAAGGRVTVRVGFCGGEPGQQRAFEWGNGDPPARTRSEDLAELLLALRDYRREVCTRAEWLLIYGPGLEADFRTCEEWIEAQWMKKAGTEFAAYPKDRMTFSHVGLIERLPSEFSAERWFVFEAGASAQAYGVGAYCQGLTRDLLPCIEQWLEAETPAEVWLLLGADGVRSVEMSLQRAALWLKGL